MGTEEDVSNMQIRVATVLDRKPCGHGRAERAGTKPDVEVFLGRSVLRLVDEHCIRRRSLAEDLVAVARGDDIDSGEGGQQRDEQDAGAHRFLREPRGM
jgi:hypothetical protein